MPAPVKYDLLLSGATVIDPSQGIDAVRDVAVRDGLVAAVSEGIDPAEARDRIDLSGRILTPGWIDIHAHVYAGATTWGIEADAHCLATGVTTIVDAGSPGWANFIGFKEFVADRARTRTLAFVHISGIGLTYGPVGEMEDLRYGDPERTACVIHNWPQICVGVKVRQARFQVGDNGVEPLRLATEAAGMVGVPVMVHIGTGVPLPEVLAGMRGGDIVTHCYQGHGDLVIGEDGRVLDAVREARERGVLFDVGHGGGSFNFGVARASLADGFLADVVSTDIHAHSIERTVKQPRRRRIEADEPRGGSARGGRAYHHPGRGCHWPPGPRNPASRHGRRPRGVRDHRRGVRVSRLPQGAKQRLSQDRTGSDGAGRSPLPS